MDSAFTYFATLLYWGLTLYEWVVIIAILLSWVNPDPRNTVMLFINGMTLPYWNWLRPYLPGQIQMFTAYISLLLIWFLKVFLPGTVGAIGDWVAGRITEGALAVQVSGYFLMGLGLVMQNFLFFLILLFLIWFFLTLVSPSPNNAIVRMVYVLVDPFISPVQRRLPRMRIDLSPLVVAGICFVISFFVVSNLIVFATGLTSYGHLGLPVGTIH